MPSTDAEDLDRLAQAFVEQARRGEAPSIEAVAREHPDLADDIRELFPVLAIVEGLKADGTVSDQRTSTMPAQVGDYVLGRELGRGGMGTVYEGRRAGGGDALARVAVKVIHAHLLERAEFLARFLQEAAAGRRVVHENVVRTLETGVVSSDGEEVPYILLEYVEGQNLRALLGEVEVVPERLCRHVGTRLADALACVHAAGLVHRDVKPENVVITNDETVKLMDLGVAVVQDRLQRLSRTGEFVGSLLYAAPGQLAGEDPEPGWDLHALGILLYELATGKHPARATGLSWLHANEATRSTLTHRDALAHLSPFFATVIESLLASEDPAHGSFATAAELRDVLAAGEVSDWWRARRDVGPTSSSRLPRVPRTTAFYGRKAEWRALDRALEAARGGRGQVVLIEGEAGIGKSRLLDEWVAAQRGTPDAPRVLLLSHAPGGALGDEGQLAAALAEILGPDELEERLAELLESRARLAPGLARRLRGEPAAPEAETYDAAWMSLIRALACAHPIVMVVEDLHFASPEDVDRLLYFARAASHARLLIVGTFRPQLESAGLRELVMLDHVAPLTLDGLDTKACHDLLLEAAHDTPQLGESVESLAERSDRNPMFLLELVRRTRAQARTEVAAETPVPDSIRGFLLARIAALEPSDRELLETAACQGHEFDPVLIAEASDAGRVDALKRFGRMERAYGLLRPAGRQYRFQHHLVQEVLYAELHPALREAYHAALGSALEAGMENPQGADAVMLCMQFLRGGQPLRIRPHFRAAMEHLSDETVAHRTAEEIAETALAVEGLLEGVDRAIALEVRGRARIGAARLDEAAQALEEAEALAHAAGEAALESDILGTRSWLESQARRPEACVRYLERAVERARAARSVEREAAALSRLGLEFLNLRQYDEADARLRQAFEALGDADQPFVRCQLINDLASIRIMQGRLEEAQELLTEADRLAHAIGAVSTEFFNAVEQGRLAFRLGRYEDDLGHLVRALECGRRLGRRHRDAFLLVHMGRCLEKLGRYDEARQRFHEAREAARRRGDSILEFLASVYSGSVRAARGSLGGALDAMSSARVAVGAVKPDLALQAALRYADLLMRLGRLDEARRVLDGADAAWTDRDVQALEVRLLAARARLEEQEGDFDEASRLLAEAAQLASDASLLAVPYVFDRARNLLRAGRGEEAEMGLRDTLAWAREHGVPSMAVLAQIYLAGHFEGDLLAARVAFEKGAERLTSSERIEALYALWEADGDEALLEAAWRELEGLRMSAPAQDRERMLTEVDLHRRVAEAWAERGA